VVAGIESVWYAFHYTAPAFRAPMGTPVRRGVGSLRGGLPSYHSTSPLRSGITRGAFSAATVIDRRGQREPHTALHQLGDWQICTVSLRQRRQVHLGAVKALLIETVDSYPVANADFVADGSNMRRLRRHRSFPRMDADLGLLPGAWPRGLDPDPPSGSAHPTPQAPPEIDKPAVVPSKLRQHFRTDHGHMAAGVAAEPDVVAFDHGVPKGLRRPVTESGRELSERDVPFWAS
jgi:hypothetical protein